MLMNPKKLYRLYREEGLSVRRRRGRKRARGTRTPMPPGPDAEPALVAGLRGGHVRGVAQIPHPGRDRRLLPREPVPDRRHQHLGRASWTHWCGSMANLSASSATFRRCYGSEFISRDLDLWACSRHVTLDFSRPGKPKDSGFIEAFNSKLRAECLNAHWFMSLADAAEKLEDWRRHYNDDRPHSAIGYNVPSALHFPGGVTSPPP